MDNIGRAIAGKLEEVQDWRGKRVGEVVGLDQYASPKMAVVTRNAVSTVLVKTTVI